LQQNITVSAGVEYTLSFYVRVPSGQQQVAYVNWGGIATRTFSISNTVWQRVTYTGTYGSTTTVSNIHFGIASTGNNNIPIQFCGMKLEVGNKATDWSLSPWDIANPQDDWIKLGLTSDFVAYGGLDTNIPRYNKVGGAIHVRGTISPTSTSNIVGSSSYTTICTLPTGYRPSGMNQYLVCLGSGIALWALEITTGGLVRAGRYRDTTGYVTPGTSAYMTFYAVFAP